VNGSNVAIVRGLFEAFEGGDAAALVDPLSPDLVFHVREDEPDAGVYEGLEAASGPLLNWVETFPDLSVEGLSLRDAGDWVIATFTLRGRGGSSGAEVAEQYSWACLLRDGKLVEVREFATEAEAVAATRGPGPT
jgi:ketosteroid isomerase-like protein